MIVYWCMLAWVIFIGAMWKLDSRMVMLGEDGLEEEYRASWRIALLAFAPIIIIAGLRSGVADTQAYIIVFNRIPFNLISGIRYLSTVTKGWGFFAYTLIFKIFISRNFQFWLFFTALFSGLCTLIPLRKYSSNFLVSVFLFVASTRFLWLMNGIRQYLAVAIIFAFIPLLEKKKWVPYIIVILIASTIHITSLIYLPIILIVQGKPFNQRTMLFIIFILLAFTFTNLFTDVLGTLLKDTEFESYVGSIEEDVGSNILLTFISLAPVLLVLLRRKKVEELATPFINICINMSVITAGFTFLGSFTSGILIGRIPIFFELFNFILIPWVLEKAYSRRDRTMIYIFMFLSYGAFFYYRINIVNGGLGYISRVLGLDL